MSSLGSPIFVVLYHSVAQCSLSLCLLTFYFIHSFTIKFSHSLISFINHLIHSFINSYIHSHSCFIAFVSRNTRNTPYAFDSYSVSFCLTSMGQQLHDPLTSHLYSSPLRRIIAKYYLRTKPWLKLWTTMIRAGTTKGLRSSMPNPWKPSSSSTVPGTWQIPRGTRILGTSWTYLWTFTKTCPLHRCTTCTWARIWRIRRRLW